jgi:hypothetical protein
MQSPQSRFAKRTPNRAAQWETNLDSAGGAPHFQDLNEAVINFQRDGLLNQVQFDEQAGSVKASLDDPFNAIKHSALNTNFDPILHVVASHWRAIPDQPKAAPAIAAKGGLVGGARLVD